MSRKYKFKNPTAVYFVSFATVYWLDIFVRELYMKVLAESLEYCRKEKAMELFAYCIMPSHVHLIFRSDDEKPSELLRDFKKYTAKHLIKAITNNPQESRQEWLLWMMQNAAKKKGNVTTHQFLQHHNQPIELWSPSVVKQKLDYIHNNPVKAGFVTNPVDWKYSSARNIAGHKDVAFEIDDIGFLG